MMADHFVDDEAQELLGKIGVELGVFREFAQARNLLFLAARIGGRQTIFGFVTPHRLRHLEPFRQHEDQRGVDIVDAVAILVQLRIGHAGLPRLHLP
jgi:hypothetical protein